MCILVEAVLFARYLIVFIRNLIDFYPAGGIILDKNLPINERWRLYHD